MNGHSNAISAVPKLSRIRTLLFGALAFVWFSEMVLWGFQSLSQVWTNVWKMIPPENPQLATALAITHAVEAPLKGALGVLAIFGLRSKDPSARTALFLSMSLVPPLNIAFQFREQGFPLGSVAVATVFSAILWGSFFLFKEPTPRPEQRATINSGPWPPSRWEIFQYAWFAFNSIALTLMAFIFLFWPRAALHFIFPCLSSLLDAHKGELASLSVSNLGTGTHLLALATATWIATVYCRSHPTLRQAVTVACAFYAGLVCLLPLRQIIVKFGGSCATPSILVPFVPLFFGWVFYAAFSCRVKPANREVRNG